MDSSTLFLNSFKQRTLSNMYQQMPRIIKNLATLCQLLDDYPLLETKIEQIHQATNECILWNDDQTHPIAIDQNNYLITFRQSIRELIHEFLEFTQQILLIDNNKNPDIHLMTEKSLKFLSILNTYRTKREIGYKFFCENYLSEDAMLVLNTIDKQQYHQLRYIALYLRQFFIQLIQHIKPKFLVLE